MGSAAADGAGSPLNCSGSDLFDASPLAMTFIFWACGTLVDARHVPRYGPQCLPDGVSCIDEGRYRLEIVTFQLVCCISLRLSAGY
jgi:hypothetical protein